MELKDLIQKIHIGCFELCHQALGVYLPVASNIGVFCQSEEVFEALTKVREELAYSSNNSNQKHFELKGNIVVEAIGAVPSAVYTHLYIRKPSADSPEAGDIDFVLSLEEYRKLKDRILSDENVQGASTYDRPGWDTIELRNLSIDTLAYVGTQEMAEKIRVRF